MSGAVKGAENIPADIPLEERCVLPHPEPTKATDGLICRRHYHRILDTLREIEELWTLRGVVLLPGPATGERHATRDGSPAPGRVAVMALSDRRNTAPLSDDDVPDVPGVLLGWYRIIEDELPLPPRRSITVVGILCELRAQRRWVARQPWVDDYANELHELHRALAGATGGGMWPESIGKCPNCGKPLFVTPGVDAITCRRCESTWSGANYLRLRLILEREERRRDAAERNAAADH